MNASIHRKQFCMALNSYDIMRISAVSYTHLDVYKRQTLYSFGEEIKPYEYYLDDGETKDFTIESHIRMLSC